MRQILYGKRAQRSAAAGVFSKLLKGATAPCALCGVLVLFVAVLPAHCQHTPGNDAPGKPVEVKGVFGWAGFLDEQMLNHFVAGASVRTYLTSRLSFEPEFLFMKGPGFDRDLVVVPSLAFDFGKSKKVRPYVIGGAGLLRHRNGIPSSPGQTTFWSGNSWTFGGGAGVKIFLNERVFLSPEFRIGYEPAMRATVGLGYRF